MKISELRKLIREEIQVLNEERYGKDFIITVDGIQFYWAPINSYYGDSYHVTDSGKVPYSFIHEIKVWKFPQPHSAPHLLVWSPPRSSKTVMATSTYEVGSPGTYYKFIADENKLIKFYTNLSSRDEWPDWDEKLEKRYKSKLGVKSAIKKVEKMVVPKIKKYLKKYPPIITQRGSKKSIEFTGFEVRM